MEPRFDEGIIWMLGSVGVESFALSRRVEFGIARRDGGGLLVRALRD